MLPTFIGGHIVGSIHMWPHFAGGLIVQVTAVIDRSKGGGTLVATAEAVKKVAIITKFHCWFNKLFQMDCWPTLASEGVLPYTLTRLSLV